MCVFACERLRLQHLFYLIKLFWICLDAIRLYEEHKLQHSLWIIMKHNTLSLALTFGNNHSNFIIECTKICFYWTCLCALKSLSLSIPCSLYISLLLSALAEIASNYSLTELNTETQLLFMRAREDALLLVSQCLLFLVCENSKWKIGFCSVGDVCAHFEFDHW